MATSTIKTAPKTLNEWTLELNIAHEIANMFDSPFGILYPIRLRGIFDILPLNLRRFHGRKTKIFKLTPAEEGSGGGWDTQMVIPTGRKTDDRVVYFQFKSGSHSDGNNVTGSKFNLSLKNPNRHIEFTFNDNDKPKKGKAATQHDDLKKLNDHLVNSGFSNKSVLYAFPRVSTLDMFERLEQPLILKTTFLSLDQMDSEAGKNGANLYDGQRHHFRTCYTNENIREVSSKPFPYLEDESGNVVEEIMLVKLCRMWNEYFSEINAERLRDYLKISSALFLNVNPFKFADNPFKYYKSQQESGFLREYFQFDRNIETDNVSYLLRIYTFLDKLVGPININEEVPKTYTNPLSNAVEEDNTDLDFGEINVSAIVF
jgi:hypothetical protein